MDEVRVLHAGLSPVRWGEVHGLRSALLDMSRFSGDKQLWPERPPGLRLYIVILLTGKHV